MVEKESLIIDGLFRTTDNRLCRRQIKVVNGVIDSVGDDLGVPDVSCGRSVEILPGFIDRHVHGREYPLFGSMSPDDSETYTKMVAKEDFRSVSRAAINGGVVAIGEMPNNPLKFAPSYPAAYERKRLVAEERCLVDCVTYALVTPETEPWRDVPYKMFTHDHDSMEPVFRRFKGTGFELTLHCENRTVIEEDPSRPPEAEYVDVLEAIDLSAKHDVPIHIAHVSCEKSLEFLAQAKASGVRVTCETTPTYLIFSDEKIGGFPIRELNHMKPPFRTEQDRQALLYALEYGTIDCLATDHAPHTLPEKLAGSRSGNLVFGIPLIDHYTHVVGWLKQNGVSARRIREICCENPGRFMERYTGERFGRIEPGYVGSFTVVKKSDPRELSSDGVMTKCSWTPFEGARLGAEYLLEAVETIVRGKSMKNYV